MPKIHDKRLKELESVQKSIDVQNIIISDEEIYLVDGNKKYYPTPTGKLFHDSDAFVRHLMGPFGSGKTTMAAMEIIRKSCEMPPCNDGIRRMRCAIIRNTTPELVSSTHKSWMDWFSDLGNVKARQKPLLSVEHRFNDGKGLIHLEVLFIACDREQDLTKLKSTEFTMAYLNEVSELPQGLMDVIKGRVNNRYPPQHMCPHNYWSGVISDTNPPDTDHWLYNLYEVIRPDGYEIFKQPSGLVMDENGDWIFNVNSENLKTENIKPGEYPRGGLTKDYYPKMALGANEEFIKVYCCGEYGIVRLGKAVYPQYNDDLHSIDSIDININHPIQLGWDFGLTPACLITQYIDGVWYIIKEFVSDNCSTSELVNESVRPWLNKYAPNLEYTSDCDPSDRGSDADNIKAGQRLDEAGIKTDPALTNNPIERIDAVKTFLSKLVNGQPGVQISRESCPVFRKGLLGDYQYRRVRVLSEERYQDKPNKTHPVSDIQDAAQYIALRLLYDFIDKNRIDTSKFMDNTVYM